MLELEDRCYKVIYRDQNYKVIGKKAYHMVRNCSACGASGNTSTSLS